MCLELSGIHQPVPQGVVHNEVVIRVGCGRRTSTSMPLWDSSSLSVWLLQPADDTLSSVATSVWEHPVWRLVVARYCWSVVRCRLGLMMSKCEQHDEDDRLNTNSNWTRRCIGCSFMDQTPVVNFAVKLLVREQQGVQKVLKHWTVGPAHSTV